jgi:hypothetical protein
MMQQACQGGADVFKGDGKYKLSEWHLTAGIFKTGAGKIT